jgi:deoxycytidylate deaminase
MPASWKLSNAKRKSTSKTNNITINMYYFYFCFQIFGVGYNGFIVGKDNLMHIWTKRTAGDDEMYNDYLQHAETNCIHFSTTPDLRDAIVFVSCLPCEQCALKLIQKRVKGIMYNISLRKFMYPSLDYFAAVKSDIALVSFKDFNEKPGEDCISVEGLDPVYSKSNWDYMFMAIASLAAKRSESPPFVWGGCVIVQDKKIISYGYSGIPQFMMRAEIPKEKPDIIQKWSGVEEYLKDLMTKAQIDCIRNALYYAGDVSGAKVYTTRIPTLEAMKEMIQREIKEVIYLEDIPSHLSSYLDPDEKVALQQQQAKVEQLAKQDNIALREFSIVKEDGIAQRGMKINITVETIPLEKAEEKYILACQEENYKPNIEGGVIIPKSEDEHVKRFQTWDRSPYSIKQSNKKAKKEPKEKESEVDTFTTPFKGNEQKPQ